MKLTYDETAMLLALLDSAPGSDLDLHMGNLHLSIQAWPQSDLVPEAGPDPSPVLSSGMHPSPEIVESQLGSKLAFSPALGICVAVNAAVGEHVREGQVLAHIEAAGGEHMTVIAPLAGWIREMDLSQGDFIEFGQALAALERE